MAVGIFLAPLAAEAQTLGIRFNQDNSIFFRARVQLDRRASDAPLEDDTDSTLDLARKRIGAEGEIAGLFDFQIERELQKNDPWRDVYINYKQFTAVQVQGGKFKLPFSLDENTSATNLDFVYRSMAATRLAPGRDRGVMVHGRVINRVLRYELGIFEHDGRNARPGIDNEGVVGGQTLAGRLLLQPFRTSKTIMADLLFGAAFTSSEIEEGFPGIRGRTVLDSRFFSPDYWVKGRRRRTGFEARWRPGPASVKAEYIRLTDERREQSVEDTDLSPLIPSGWYISGTWALTGENKADGLDEPKRPFLRGGIGAVELAIRFEGLKFESAASGEEPSTSPRADVIVGNRDRALTFGANWYLNRWIKVQFNFIREDIDDPEQGPLPSQPRFWSRVFRLQFTI